MTRPFTVIRKCWIVYSQRGRHAQVSIIVATQKCAAISPIIKVIANEVYCFRLRTYHDLEMLLQENPAVKDKQTISNIYHMVTDETHLFYM